MLKVIAMIAPRQCMERIAMGTSQLPAAAGSTDALPAGRPTHIVVFRRPRSANVAMIARTIGLASKPISVAGRPGLLESAAAEVPFSYYQRFGVAAVTLDEAQRRELATHAEVEGIYANLMRSIPRPVTPPAPVPAVPGMAVPTFAAPVGARSTAEAYLMGMIDAAQGALTAMRLVVAAPPPGAARAQTATQLSWSLRAIGITTKTRWTGKGIKVAVLDTGIDQSHPDFQGRIAAYKNFAVGSSDNDVVEHGTHCAGVIAGAKRPVPRGPSISRSRPRTSSSQATSRRPRRAC